MRAREVAPLVSTRAMQRVATLLFALTAIVLFAGGAAWISQRPWFDLHRVELRAAEGELRHINANIVRAATVGRLRGNFFTLSLDDARRVFEAVPWVAAVSVRRGWPDQLIVTLTEHRAIAVWGDGRLLANGGQLFVANVAEAEVDGALPQVDAPARYGAEVARRLPQLAAQFESLGLALESIEISERANWTLHADGGLAIVLGRDEPAGRLDERLALLAEYYPALAGRLGAEPIRIDMRYPQGFAVATASRNKP